MTSKRSKAVKKERKVKYRLFKTDKQCMKAGYPFRGSSKKCFKSLKMNTNKSTENDS